MAIQGARPEPGRIVPHLLVRDASAAIEFYKKALGAVELYRSPLPGGAGIHADIRIADSMLMLTDFSECQGDSEGRVGSPQSLGGTSVLLEIIVKDVDAAFQRAVDVGAKPTLPVSDTFWGDRYGWVTDPFGRTWALATVKEELTPAEVQRRMEQYMSRAQ